MKTTGLLIACLACGMWAAANTGVAFVHGTGEQTDALNDYWLPEFVNSVRQGLPDPNHFVVVNCGFDHYMWTEEAAGCAAGQLYDFIMQENITDLVIILHSGGGNVIRWIMSNPTWDWRYPVIIDRIRWVNALGVTSLGTPLANAVMEGTVFEAAVGWLLGYQNDMVRMQQTHWMSYYNQYWLYGTSGRPSLPKGFWSIIGTDVETSIFDPDSYCGGYSLNLGLEITQNWLDNCSDGFVNCSSQAGAGYVWVEDVNFTDGDEPLSHNQSRRKCFGLDRLLRDDL